MVHDIIVTYETVTIGGQVYDIPQREEKMPSVPGATARNAYIGATLAHDYMNGRTPRICIDARRVDGFPARAKKMGFVRAALREALEFRWYTHAKMTRDAWRRARREIRAVFRAVDVANTEKQWDEMDCA